MHGSHEQDSKMSPGTAEPIEELRSDEGTAVFLRRPGVQFFPVMILVLLLLTHTYLVHGSNGNPWKFGGYSMFSVPQTRYLDAYLVDERGRAHHVHNYRIQDEYARAYSRARNLPNTSELCLLAKRLNDLKWSSEPASRHGQAKHAANTYQEALGPGSASPFSLDEIWFARRTRANDASSAIQIASIEVRVAEIAYEPDENRTHRRPLASVMCKRDGTCRIP